MSGLRTLLFLIIFPELYVNNVDTVKIFCFNPIHYNSYIGKNVSLDMIIWCVCVRVYYFTM